MTWINENVDYFFIQKGAKL